MSTSPERHRLISRIRSVRTSLQGPSNPAAEETPVEEYERRQSESRLDFEEALYLCLLGWLASQAFVVIGIIGTLGWAEPQPSWLWLSVTFLWCVSMVLAAAMGVLALRHHRVLRKRWLVGSFGPWAILTGEALVVVSRVS